MRDQNAGLAFYRDKLGFEVVVDTGSQEWGRRIAVAPPVPETAVLSLVGTSPKVPGRRTGVTLVTDNIAAKFEERSRQGVCFLRPPAPVPWGFHASFEDSDGNQFNLAQSPRMVDILNA